MILRRFMQHVKEQNWFAVGLDVLVVIVGIFLGLQVQAAYEEQNNRKIEQAYLVEIHNDLLGVLENAAFHIENVIFRHGALKSVLDPYFENGEFGDISNLQCNSIIISNTMTNFILPLVSVEQLDAQGNALLIRNDKLRRLLAAYRLRRERTESQINQMFSMSNELADEFPAVIKIVSDRSGLDIRRMGSNQCFSENIPDYPDFANKIVNNLTYQNSYNLLAKAQYAQLEEIHAAIDQELGIEH